MACSGGYRQPLASMLSSSSDDYEWKFVGTVEQQGGAAQHGGFWHDGHPGWRIDQIAGTCYPPTAKACEGGNSSFFKTWTALQPDYIVLMIGTNDISMSNHSGSGRIRWLDIL